MADRITKNPAGRAVAGPAIDVTDRRALQTVADQLSPPMLRFLDNLPASAAASYLDWRSLPALKRRGLASTPGDGWVWPTELGRAVRDHIRTQVGGVGE